ncbi:MAG TPA: acyl carrier protein [Gemmatimonadales bacterium]|nr:acyl carrier protein [Gemmatimonadales bacterium]
MNETASTLSQAQIVDRTRAYVRDTFLYMRPDWNLRDEDLLIGSGVIDSIGVVELIAFLQDTFGVTIGEDEITEQNLGSLVAIGQFIAHKCHGNGAVREGPSSRAVG